ncbi:MAG TPA: PIN domain-containing protein, partial [Luteolibacter sp.]
WRDETTNLTGLWGDLGGLDSASPKIWMDAYLAAFAILHEIEFVTFDRDFKRFEPAGLKLRLLNE